MNPPNKFIQFEEIDSTNNYLKQLMRTQTVEEGTVVVAGFQSGGRGQQGNSWFSSKGKNLLFSMLLYPKNLCANEMFILSCVASLAIEKVLSKYIDHVRIKWPNDIYWKDKKIAGILIENTLSECFVKTSVIGIGLNINEQRFPDSLPNPVSLTQITKQLMDKGKILEEILQSFDALYRQLEKGESERIKKAYMRKLYRSVGYFSFEDSNGVFFAKILDVHASGHLIIETREGEQKKYAFKEIQFI